MRTICAFSLAIFLGILANATALRASEVVTMKSPSFGERNGALGDRNNVLCRHIAESMSALSSDTLSASADCRYQQYFAQAGYRVHLRLEGLEGVGVYTLSPIFYAEGTEESCYSDKDKIRSFNDSRKAMFYLRCEIDYDLRGAWLKGRSRWASISVAVSPTVRFGVS